jgi:hypothetical protein
MPGKLLPNGTTPWMQKYREIMSQKLALQFGKHEEAAPRGEAESPKYE